LSYSPTISVKNVLIDLFLTLCTFPSNGCNTQICNLERFNAKSFVTSTARLKGSYMLLLLLLLLLLKMKK